LVISCLTGIVASLTTAPDVKTALERAMMSLGAVLREMVRNNVGARVYIAPCLPRDIPDFGTHSSFALVTIGNNKRDILSKIVIQVHENQYKNLLINKYLSFSDA